MRSAKKVKHQKPLYSISCTLGLSDAKAQQEFLDFLRLQMQKSSSVVLSIIALCGFILVATSIEAPKEEKFIRMLCGVSLLISGFAGLAMLCVSYKYLWYTEMVSPLALILPTICLNIPRMTGINDSIEAGSYADMI